MFTVCSHFLIHSSLFLSVTAYIYGFDHHFLEAMHAYTSSDACPLLATEGLALAGLVECAGGNLENTEVSADAAAANGRVTGVSSCACNRCLTAFLHLSHPPFPVSV